ncbi:MAG: hypothetical protein R3A44_06830 [Caldilineaceae bacterium]
MQLQSSKNRSIFHMELLARFIRNLSYREKVRLVTLVPELRTIESEPEQISNEQAALMDFFDAIVPDNLPSLPDNGIFINDLSFADFFSLPEREQALIWAQAHTIAESELENIEKDAKPDAIPAR